MTDTELQPPRWLQYLDLGLAIVACAVWYALPGAGAWPLFLALVPWVLRFVLTGRASLRTPFDLPLILFLMLSGLGVWSAFDRPAAWTKFWLIVGSLLLFYALVNAEPLGHVRVWLLAAFGAGVAFYFVATHDWDAYPAKIGALTGLGRAIQAPLPVLQGHRLHPNVAGGIMAMMAPYSGAAVVWSARRTRAQPRAGGNWLQLVASLVLLVGTCFGVVMTTSRGAWLGLAVAVGLAWLWAAARWFAGHSRLSQPVAFAGISALVLIAVLVVALAWPGGMDALVERVPGPDTAASRLELLREGLMLAGDYPLVGAGLGSFMMQHSTYALLLHVGYTVHSHNLLLNISIELGILAVLVVLWMWAIFGWSLFRAAQQAGPDPGLRTGREALGAAAMSLVVLIVHGLADDVLFGSRGAILLFVPLSFAVPFARGIRPRGRRWLTFGLPVLLIALSAGVLLLRGPFLSRISSNLGAVLQSRAELSVYQWPEYPIQDAVRREVELGRPIALYERALDLDPGNASANRRLGQIELSLGQYDAALGHLEAAYAAAPGNLTARQLLGEAHAATGDYDRARALWSGLRNSQGQMRIRAFWYGRIGRDEVADWMAQMAAGQ